MVPGSFVCPLRKNSGCRRAHPQASRSQIKSQQGKLGQTPLLSRAPPGSPAPCPLGRLPGVEAAAKAEVRAPRSLSYTSSGASCRLFCPGRGFRSEPPRGLRAWADSSTAPAAAATAHGGAPHLCPTRALGNGRRGGCGSFRTLAPRAGDSGCFVPEPPGCAECEV